MNFLCLGRIRGEKFCYWENFLEIREHFERA